MPQLPSFLPEVGSEPTTSFNEANNSISDTLAFMLHIYTGVTSDICVSIHLIDLCKDFNHGSINFPPLSHLSYMLVIIGTC